MRKSSINITEEIQNECLQNDDPKENQWETINNPIKNILMKDKTTTIDEVEHQHDGKPFKTIGNEENSSDSGCNLCLETTSKTPSPNSTNCMNVNNAPSKSEAQLNLCPTGIIEPASMVENQETINQNVQTKFQKSIHFY
jgi:hypothetical protein